MDGQEELHAFIDGELDRSATMAFAAKIAATPALAREVARFRADKAMLAKVYGDLADQPIPDRLLAPLRSVKRRRPMTRPLLGGAALALGLALWVMLPASDSLVRDAMAVRQGERRPLQQVTAESLNSPTAADALVSERLSLPLRVPDLAAAGYHLSAIALFQQAAQISYRDRAGKLFTLYLRHAGGADRFDMQRQGGIEICVWQNAELAVTMIGDLSAKEMLRLASATYADLNL